MYEAKYSSAKLEKAYQEGREYEQEINLKNKQRMKNGNIAALCSILIFLILPLLIYAFFNEKQDIYLSENGKVKMMISSHFGLKNMEYDLRYNREESNWEIKEAEGEWRILLNEFDVPEKE